MPTQVFGKKSIHVPPVRNVIFLPVHECHSACILGAVHPLLHARPRLHLQNHLFPHLSHDYQNRIQEICRFHPGTEDIRLLHPYHPPDNRSNDPQDFPVLTLSSSYLHIPHNIVFLPFVSDIQPSSDYHTADNNFHFSPAWQIHLPFPRTLQKTASPDYDQYIDG